MYLWLSNHKIWIKKHKGEEKILLIFLELFPLKENRYVSMLEIGAKSIYRLKTEITKMFLNGLSIRR